MSHYSKCGALVFIFSLIVPSSAAFAADPAKAKEKPGETPKAIEKQRDPSRHHTPDRSAQMTLSGARYFVIGSIRKIEDNDFYVRDEELGEDVCLVMDKGSKVICTVRTSEGTVRDCVLSVGDRVCAEISDLGTVTTIRALPPEEKLTSVKPTRQHMGDILNIASPSGDYVVAPVPLGSLRDVEPQGPTLVKDPNGKPMGALHKLIMDAGSERIICAVIRKADDATLVPVPWADLTISKQEGAVILTNRYLQLEPPESPKSLFDRSPKMEELNRLIQELQASIPADIQAGGQQSAHNQQRHTAKAPKADCPDAQKEKGNVVRGQVVDAQDDFVIVRDSSSGTLIHVHKDQCTRQVL